MGCIFLWLFLFKFSFIGCRAAGIQSSTGMWNFSSFFFPYIFSNAQSPPFKEPVRWAIIKDWQFPSRIKKIFFKNSLNRNTQLKNRHFQRMFFRLVHCKRNSLNQIIQTQPVPLFYFFKYKRGGTIFFTVRIYSYTTGKRRSRRLETRKKEKNGHSVVKTITRQRCRKHLEFRGWGGWGYTKHFIFDWDRRHG